MRTSWPAAVRPAASVSRPTKGPLPSVTESGVEGRKAKRTTAPGTSAGASPGTRGSLPCSPRSRRPRARAGAAGCDASPWRPPGGEAEVAAHRARHRAAHAEAVAHGDRGLGAAANRLVGGVRLLVVRDGARPVLAVFLDLRDVRARRERLGAGAPIDDGADRLVLGEAFGDPGELLPHREADRVASLGPVEDDGGDGPVRLHENVGHFVTSMTPARASSSIWRAS